MTIRKTTLADLSEVLDIYAYAREQMAAAGNPQWAGGRPSEETIRSDIEAGNSYVMLDGDALVGVFTLILGDEPTTQSSKTAPGWTTNPTERSTASRRTGKPVASCRRRWRTVKVYRPTCGWTRTRRTSPCSTSSKGTGMCIAAASMSMTALRGEPIRNCVEMNTVTGGQCAVAQGIVDGNVCRPPAR